LHAFQLHTGKNAFLLIPSGRLSLMELTGETRWI
jgi:hypothetical protein